jgi:hypothetical protein
MRILFDHGTPSGIAKALTGHEVIEAYERGWERISNGALLAAAEHAGFSLLLATGKNTRYQQNLAGRQNRHPRSRKFNLANRAAAS